MIALLFSKILFARVMLSGPLLPVSLAREMENNVLMRVRVLVEW